MRSADEVIAYLDKLRTTIQYLGASDCKLNEGSMRADVNLSIREVGAKEFGTRTEMKNLNSFKAIARAIENERERQIDLLEAGETVTQETRRWEDEKEYSEAMRSKEDAQDYRYFPDPDLVPIIISDEWLEEIRASQPEFKDEKKEFNAPVGSSANKISGSLINPLTIATLCASPPDSWEGNLSVRAGRPRQGTALAVLLPVG